MSDPSSESATSHSRFDDMPTRVEPSSDGGERTASRLDPTPIVDDHAPPSSMRIGRYTVLRRLGQGGMGVVYAAYDDELDRRVAIKLLLSRSEDGSLGRARLQREAQALAKLSHPNVVQVYETGSHDDQVYLVMEYVEGPTLSDWRADVSPSWREIVDMFIETGKGLAAAHRTGLIHRDFKPANVIVGDDGRPRILDFGLARAGALLPGESLPLSAAASMSMRAVHLSESQTTSLNTELTQAGTLLGTPAYMAPEQIFLAETDARCDIYAFAVSLWEALYGQRPYPARSVEEIRAQLREGPPTIPKGQVPSEIGRVLLRGLAFDRDERIPTMEVFLAALASAAKLRRRLLMVAAAALFLAATIAAAYFIARAEVEDPALACAGAGELGSIWSPAIADELKAAFTGLDLSYAAATWATIEPRLDRYASELKAAEAEACIAQSPHRGPLPPALREQVACLDHRRLELETVVEQLRAADAKVVEHAVAAVTGLSPLAHCTDLDRLAADSLRRSRGGYPDDGDDRWAAIEALLVEARIAQGAESFDRAHRLAGEALLAAEAADARPLHAAALHRLGVIAEHRGVYDEARANLEAALLEAEAVTDDRLVADVAIELMRTDGINNADARSSRTWELLAKAKLARVGEDPRQRIHLDLHRAIVGLETGDRAGAAQAVGEAVKLAERHREDLPSLYISALNIRSAVEKGTSDLRGAEATLRDALARHIELFGEGHPYQAMLTYNIGAVEMMRSDLVAARSSFERALAAREAAYGPDHPDVAQSLVGLAAILSDQDEAEAAIPLLERALRIDERARGADNPELIFPLYNLSEALVLVGRIDEAEAPLLRAMAILDGRELHDTAQAVLVLTGIVRLDNRLGRHDAVLARIDDVTARALKVYGDEHPSLAEMDLQRARALIGLGDLSAAESLVNAALAHLDGHPDQIDLRTTLTIEKATILWSTDRRGDATDLVQGALKALESSEVDASDFRAVLGQWLAEHPSR